MEGTSKAIDVIISLEKGRAVLIKGVVFKMVKVETFVDGLSALVTDGLHAIQANHYYNKEGAMFYKTTLPYNLMDKDLEFTILD